MHSLCGTVDTRQYKEQRVHTQTAAQIIDAEACKYVVCAVRNELSSPVFVCTPALSFVLVVCCWRSVCLSSSEQCVAGCCLSDLISAQS